MAAASVLDPAAIARATAEERREAQRACKSLVLRQEVFALDAPATGATEAELQRQMLPYRSTPTAATSSCCSRAGPTRMRCSSSWRTRR